MMSIVLDLLMVLIIVVCTFRARNRTVYRNVANLLVLIAVFVGSILLTFVLRPVVQPLFVEPSYARSVSTDIAHMGNVSVMDDPYNTVAGVDIRQLIEKHPEQFEAMLKPYDVTTQNVVEATQSAQENGMTESEAALKAIISPAAADISKAISYVILFLIFWLILRSLGKQIYERRALGVKMTRNTAASMGLGVLSGLLWCYVFLAVLIKCAYPYSFGGFSVLGLNNGVDNSILTRFFVLFNPF